MFRSGQHLDWRIEMTNTAAAENLAKEKVEKRRALGRGLESLLPGPRVVAAVPRPAAADETITIQAVVEEGATFPPFAKNAKDGAASVSSLPVAAELSSSGQPRAAVPTQTLPHAPVDDETISISAQAEGRVPGNLVINLNISDIDKNPFQTRYVD